MGAYIVRRLLLMIPTLFGIMAISFAITQFAPGGPVEEMIARMTGNAVAATARITDTGNEAGLPGGSPKSTVTAAGGSNQDAGSSGYRGSRGFSEKYLAQIKAKFGFDRPPPTPIQNATSACCGDSSTEPMARQMRSGSGTTNFMKMPTVRM